VLSQDLTQTLRIGYFKKEAEATELAAKYQATWKPLSFLAKEIYFMSRSSQDAPWEVRDVVPLGGQLRGKPCFATGETTAS
jgi:hypothetical protein